MSPDFRSECFSSAKVEKVVNPPQKPVASKIEVEDDIRFSLLLSPNSIPINKQPTMLTVNVPRKKLLKTELSFREIK